MIIKLFFLVFQKSTIGNQKKTQIIKQKFLPYRMCFPHTLARGICNQHAKTIYWRCLSDQLRAKPQTQDAA
jgi:hypothetical protein